MSLLKKLLHKNWSFSKEILLTVNFPQLYYVEAPQISWKIFRGLLMMQSMFTALFCDMRSLFLELEPQK
jgi:hypothetical protein